MSNKFQSLYDGMQSSQIEQRFKILIENKLYQTYGDAPDDQISLRFQEEWTAMEQSKTVLDVAAMYELTTWLKENNHPYQIRGCVGASFILYLLEITSGNPLPPHYRCPECHAIQWQVKARDGFDLPTTRCGACDNECMIPDGHDIPWQTLWGYDGYEPVFDIDIPEDLEKEILELADRHWLKEFKPFREVYPFKNSVVLGQLRINYRLDRNAIRPDFFKNKIDFRYSTIAIDNRREIFECAEDNVEWDRININSFADFVYLYGLCNTFGAWDDDTESMVQSSEYFLSDLIAFRDDVFSYLIAHNYLPKDAWKGMNRARNGLPLLVISEDMTLSPDSWILQRLEKIRYLFPKAHAVEFILFRLKALDFPSVTRNDNNAI